MRPLELMPYAAWRAGCPPCAVVGRLIRFVVPLVLVAACREPSGAATPGPGLGAGVGPLLTPQLVETPPPPGGGVVAGRLVDATTGLPVSRATVRLQDRGRRTPVEPDGRFRFDAVQPGPVTLVFEPDETHLARSAVAYLGDDGIDFGIVPLQAAGEGHLLVPEYGGVVEGCDRTQLALATEAITGPVSVRVTCIQDPALFPSPPPAGRLPLASVALGPAEVAISRPAVLTVGLPDQPRYGPGVPLDLYRFDMDRARWEKAGTVEVDREATAAQGEVSELGEYLVASPPFGALAASPGSRPSVSGLHTTARPGGAPEAVFDAGTAAVFLAFDYGRMANTRIRVATSGLDGGSVNEVERPYSGEGHDDLPLVPRGAAWPSGTYTTTLTVGGVELAGPLVWQVGEAVAALASPEPVASAPPVLVAPPCRPPVGWYPYRVRLGDTLFGLALAVGFRAEAIQTANCMATDQLLAGQVLYLPRAFPPPAGPVGPWPKPTPYPRWSPPRRPLPWPTTWYTPPAGGGSLPDPGDPEPTAPLPEVTLAPRPTP